MDSPQTNKPTKRSFWSFLFKPSTLAFIKEARKTPGFSVFNWIHGYIYIRWLYLYIRFGSLFLPIWRMVTKRWKPKIVDEQTSQCIAFADTYHGKVVSLEQATRLVSINRDIELKNLEQIIPYALARDIILQHPTRH
ncbi:MAG: hypothetical protein D3910_27495, partial [Candidatus Electrothrix sp. ATG2]|nr:hypothetical protein [Candidatus Electrothrix sp. ATG2]